MTLSEESPALRLSLPEPSSSMLPRLVRIRPPNRHVTPTCRYNQLERRPPMTEQLLDELLDERDELARLKINAILRGETDIANCPECVEQKKKCDELYRRVVEGLK
jgi:hypothetical protein